MQHVYSEEALKSSAETKHKEEGEMSRTLVCDDREWIGAKLEKHPHPSSIKSGVLYNIVNGQVALNEVKVSDAGIIGEKMATSFHNSLSSGFHAMIPDK